jgi:hypothetical protein
MLMFSNRSVTLIFQLMSTLNIIIIIRFKVVHVEVTQALGAG